MCFMYVKKIRNILTWIVYQKLFDFKLMLCAKGYQLRLFENGQLNLVCNRT